MVASARSRLRRPAPPAWLPAACRINTVVAGGAMKGAGSVASSGVGLGPGARPVARSMSARISPGGLIAVGGVLGPWPFSTIASKWRASRRARMREGGNGLLAPRAGRRRRRRALFRR